MSGMLCSPGARSSIPVFVAVQCSEISVLKNFLLKTTYLELVLNIPWVKKYEGIKLKQRIINTTTTLNFISIRWNVSLKVKNLIIMLVDFFICFFPH